MEAFAVPGVPASFGTASSSSSSGSSSTWNAAPPAIVRGSGSFMNIQALSDGGAPGEAGGHAGTIPPPSESPDPFASHRLRTPHAPPSVAAARRRAQFGAVASGHRDSLGSNADSELSMASTVRMPACDFSACDFSPAVRSEPYSQRKVPSCPQKQSGHARKPPAALGDGGSDAGTPNNCPQRDLSSDLEQTDPVQDLVRNHLCGMAIASPAGPPACSLTVGHAGMSAPAHHVSASAVDLFGAAASHGGGLGGERRPYSSVAPQAGAEANKRARSALTSHFDNLGDESDTDVDDDDDDGGSSSWSLPPPAALPIPRLDRPGSFLAVEGEGAEVRGPTMVARQNSIMETKMLVPAVTSSRLSRRAGSFVSKPSGTRDLRFEDHYEWLELMGSGSYASVYAVRHRERPEVRYAVKVSKEEFRSRNKRKEYLQEMKVAHAMGSNPNIVEYIAAWQEAQVFYMQIELCEGGTLKRFMEHDAQRCGGTLRTPAGESKVWDLVLHVSRGLEHMHRGQYIHCDLKPDNILLSGTGAWKIGDLGIATHLNDWVDDLTGDPCYLSRDLLNCQPSTAADIFSLGIMLYEIVSGEELPGQGERWVQLRESMPTARGEPSAAHVPMVPPPASCSTHMHRLISTAMSPVPAARPTALNIKLAVATALEEQATRAAAAFA